MECSHCRNLAVSVIDSRDYDSTTIRRRRECDRCGWRFTTYERIESPKLMVKKRNGGIEPYARDKIIHGLKLATEKRGISDQILESVTAKIENKILGLDDGHPINSKLIGEWTMKELKQIDHIAYLRFKSVYKSFTSLKAFEKELEKLQEK